MYFNGTVSVKKGSKQLIGVGTKFKYAMANISAGQLITIDSSAGREINIIQSIQSNEELTLFWESKIDISNATYVISTTIAGSLPDYGQKNSATVQWANKLIDGISQLMTSQSDTIKIEMPYGEIVELKTYKSKVSVGDFGLGSNAIYDGSTPSAPVPKDANDIATTGFYAGGGSSALNYFNNYYPLLSLTRTGGDGTGYVTHIQGTNNGLGFRHRVQNKWSIWYECLLKNVGGIQWVDGEVRFTDAVGAVSRDEKNSAWLSLTRTEPDIYVKRNGVADTYKFPDTRGGKLLASSKIYDYKNPVIVEKDSSLALQCYHDFRKHYTSINNVLSYPFGYSSGFINIKGLFGGTGEGAVGLVNFRNWGDKSGHGSCFQLACVGGNPTDSKLYYRSGVTGSDEYPNLNMKRILDDNQVDSVNNSTLNDTRMGTGFFRQGGGAGTSDWFSGWGSGINLKYDWNNSVKIFFHGSSGVPTIATKRGSDIWWNVLLGSANTTVDSNGFVKKASPIININPDGTFTTNDESEGATVVRVDRGEYLIEGVLGFNSDAGWGGADGGIEIPLDVNKQPLIWVDAEINKDGSILVRTYHRTHPNAPKFARNDIDDYSDGDPIDIPDGRFISVRVQMPEQSIYNVRMREIEEANKEEEKRRKEEEEMKKQFGLGDDVILL